MIDDVRDWDTVYKKKCTKGICKNINNKQIIKTKNKSRTKPVIRTRKKVFSRLNTEKNSQQPISKFFRSKTSSIHDLTQISARIIYMSRKFHTSVIYTKNRYLYKNPSKNITRLEIKFPKPFTNFQYRSGLKTIIQYRLIPFIIFQYQFGNYDTASFYVLFHFLFIFVSIFKNI